MLPQRFQIKLFERGTPQVALTEVVPVFHEWIRGNALDELLIDVADYKHVAGGPGVLLVGFESDYSLSAAGGRRGLTHIRKKVIGSDLADEITASLGRLARACRLLESVPRLEGRISFDPGELEFTFLDRLVLTGGKDSVRRVAPILGRGLERVDAAGSGGVV